MKEFLQIQETARQKLRVQNSNCYFNDEVIPMTDFSAFQALGTPTQEPEYVISRCNAGTKETTLETVGHYKDDQLVLLKLEESNPGEDYSTDDDDNPSQIVPPYRSIVPLSEKNSLLLVAGDMSSGKDPKNALNCAIICSNDDEDTNGSVCHPRRDWAYVVRLDSERTTTLLPKWHFETYYLTILTTVAGCGILIAVSTMTYILCKMCSDVLEGSQSFSVLLLVSVCLIYASVIPFNFYPDELICQFRLFCPVLAYVTVFATLLSRSIMLATADMDGLPGIFFA